MRNGIWYLSKPVANQALNFKSFFFCYKNLIFIFQAFMTGLVFAKVARPKQRTQTLMFSKTAVINLRDGDLCLMFRVGDMRAKSHMIGASIKAFLVSKRTTAEGEVLNPHLSELKVRSNHLLQHEITIVHCSRPKF